MSQPNVKKVSAEEVLTTVGQGAALIKNKAIPKKQKFIIALSVLVLISPVDFLPEIVFGPAGLIDDAGLAIWSSVILFARHVANKKLAGAALEPVEYEVSHAAAH